MNIPLPPRNVVTGIAGSTRVEPIEAKPAAPEWPLRIAIGALVEAARSKNGLWKNTNPHTGMPNRGKRQPAGVKLARLAAAHQIGVCHAR